MRFRPILRLMNIFFSMEFESMVSFHIMSNCTVSSFSREVQKTHFTIILVRETNFFITKLCNYFDGKSFIIWPLGENSLTRGVLVYFWSADPCQAAMCGSQLYVRVPGLSAHWVCRVIKINSLINNRWVVGG